MRRRRLLALPLAFTVAAAAPVSAESRERYLLAQLAASLRGWIRIEGSRLAGAAPSETGALAAVRNRYPDLTVTDASVLAFLILMVAARDIEGGAQMGRPLPGEPQPAPQRAMAARSAALHLMAGASDRASDALRALR
jgi:hypothetical protein